MKEFEGHPAYLAACNIAKSTRPTLPAWDATQDNTNEWKRKSAMQEGFDLCLAVFAKHLVK